MSKNPDPLNPAKTQKAVRDLAMSAQQRAMGVQERMNNASLIAAMQEGYKMACKDNGLPIPKFADAWDGL